MPPPRESRDDLLARYDEDAWRTVEAGAAAEAQGDAEGALQLHRAGPHTPGSLREQMLSEVSLLAGDAPLGCMRAGSRSRPTDGFCCPMTHGRARRCR